MTDEVSFQRISPVVPGLDLDSALDRYRRLGFDVEPYAGGERYGFVERGPVSIHLTEWQEHDPGRTGAHVYIYVSNLMRCTPNGKRLASRAAWANPPTPRTACASLRMWTPTEPCFALAHR